MSTLTRRVALIVAAVPVVFAACTKKDEPAPVVAQTTTTTVPATTVPPEPTAVPTPVAAWRTARWGMKRAEILAAFKGEAQRLPKPADFAQPQPGSSLPPGSSDVTIPSYEAYGVTFRVLFGFQGDALTRIHLQAIKPTAATCSDVEKAVTAAKADPSLRTQTGSSLKGEEIVWKRPDQTIILNCAGVASLGFVTVTLDHLSPAQDAAKD